MNEPAKASRRREKSERPARVPGPSQTRSAETREKLLAAATAGFARDGYEGYSSRMLSTDSTVHHGLIAYHFGGKLGLWKACMLRIMDDTRAHKAELLQEAPDDVARLRIILDEFIRFNARRPEFQAFMLDAEGRSDGRFDWVMETMGRQAHDHWKSLIVSAQAAGRFVEGDPDTLLNIFYGAATRMYVMAGEAERNLGHSPFDPELVERHVRTCLGLFFRD